PTLCSPYTRLHLRLAGTDKRGIRGRKLRDWALHCEELSPGLDNRLVTCVEIAEEDDSESAFESSPVAKALLRDTSTRFGEFEPERAIPGRHIGVTGFCAILPLAIFLMAFCIFGNGMGRLVSSLYHYRIPIKRTVFLASPLAGIEGLVIRPGDVEVPRGSSVSIEAEMTLSEPVTVDVVPITDLLRHAEEGDEAESYTMYQDEESSLLYRLAVHDITEDIEYQVKVQEPEKEKSGGKRKTAITSSLYRITIYDPPEIEEVMSTLTPPEYTGLPAEEIEGMYITGLVNSSVKMQVSSTLPLASARLVGEEGEIIKGKISDSSDADLQRKAEFDLVLSEDKSLRLEILDKFNHGNIDPPLIMLRANEDDPPKVRNERPGGDWSVNPVAEVNFEVAASDDYGLQMLSWEYRINAGPLKEEVLFSASPDGEAVREQSGTRLLTLETLDVEVGDSIYYRFVARDKQPDELKGAGYSQPFFVTVRPFEQIFYQGPGGEAGGGGQPGPPPPSQREVIVATTRFADRMHVLTESEKADMSQEISRVQREVRLFVEKLKGKLTFATKIPDLDARLKHLDSAIGDMKEAEKLLEAVKPHDALQPENSALGHLNAALAGLPETVTQGVGGGGSNQINLSDQRLDLENNKYEMYDKPKSDSDLDKELAKALMKVKELSERQKEFLEELKREKT
ncbi:hypothetical protein ACFL1X_14920, partial [Candidatus Hydrogenedentota bacterium]